jgi:hypothetical protein
MTIIIYHILDVQKSLEAAIQLSNNIEHYVSVPIYAKFLKKLVPFFINCLNSPPVFTSTSPEQVRTPRASHE